MRRLLAVAIIFCLGWYVRAQTLAPPWQVGVPTAATHTACTVTVSTTQMCLASDGLWLSINGGAYVQVQAGTVAGVTSISINGGAPVSGAVSFTVPSKAVSTTTTTLQ